MIVSRSEGCKFVVLGKLRFAEKKHLAQMLYACTSISATLYGLYILIINVYVFICPIGIDIFNIFVYYGYPNKLYIFLISSLWIDLYIYTYLVHLTDGWPPVYLPKFLSG